MVNRKVSAVAGGGDAQGLQGLAGVGQTGFAIVQGVVVGQGHALHAAQRQNLPVGRRPPEAEELFGRDVVIGQGPFQIDKGKIVRCE